MSIQDKVILNAFQDNIAFQERKTVNAIQYDIPVQDKTPVQDKIPIQDKTPVLDKIPVHVQDQNKEILPIQYNIPIQDKLLVQDNKKCIIIENNQPTIYSIFHSIVSFFAIYLSFKCNNGFFNFGGFFMAIFFPYIYIIYKYTNKRVCCRF